MDANDRAIFDQMEVSGYLPELVGVAKNMCRSFWWHGTDSDGKYRILHNGTVCFFDTGLRLVAVTAAHVYEQYLLDRIAHPDLVCQFGDITIDPENRLISLSKEFDLATFDVSPVVVAASGASPHVPISWPTNSVARGDVVLYGGFPGILRVEHQTKAEMPFQWFASPCLSVTPESIKMYLDFANFHRPLVGAQVPNIDLGGMSGGPVFRHIKADPIERLELVGFIYELQDKFELVLASPAQCVRPDGTIDNNAAF